MMDEVRRGGVKETIRLQCGQQREEEAMFLFGTCHFLHRPHKSDVMMHRL